MLIFWILPMLTLRLRWCAYVWPRITDCKRRKFHVVFCEWSLNTKYITTILHEMQACTSDRCFPYSLLIWSFEAFNKSRQLQQLYVGMGNSSCRRLLSSVLTSFMGCYNTSSCLVSMKQSPRFFGDDLARRYHIFRKNVNGIVDWIWWNMRYSDEISPKV